MKQKQRGVTDSQVTSGDDYGKMHSGKISAIIRKDDKQRPIGEQT